MCYHESTAAGSFKFFFGGISQLNLSFPVSWLIVEGDRGNDLANREFLGPHRFGSFLEGQWDDFGNFRKI